MENTVIQRFSIKNPETQTKQKNCRSSEKSPSSSNTGHDCKSFYSHEKRNNSNERFPFIDALKTIKDQRCQKENHRDAKKEIFANIQEKEREIMTY